MREGKKRGTPCFLLAKKNVLLPGGKGSPLKGSNMSLFFRALCLSGLGLEGGGTGDGEIYQPHYPRGGGKKGSNISLEGGGGDNCFSLLHPNSSKTINARIVRPKIGVAY